MASGRPVAAAAAATAEVYRYYILAGRYYTEDDLADVAVANFVSSSAICGRIHGRRSSSISLKQQSIPFTQLFDLALCMQAHVSIIQSYLCGMSEPIEVKRPRSPLCCSLLLQSRLIAANYAVSYRVYRQAGWFHDSTGGNRAGNGAVTEDATIYQCSLVMTGRRKKLPVKLQWAFSHQSENHTASKIARPAATILPGQRAL